MSKKPPVIVPRNVLLRYPSEPQCGLSFRWLDLNANVKPTTSVDRVNEPERGITLHVG